MRFRIRISLRAVIVIVSLLGVIFAAARVAIQTYNRGWQREQKAMVALTAGWPSARFQIVSSCPLFLRPFVWGDDSRYFQRVVEIDGLRTVSIFDEEAPLIKDLREFPRLDLIAIDTGEFPSDEPAGLRVIHSDRLQSAFPHVRIVSVDIASRGSSVMPDNK